MVQGSRRPRHTDAPRPAQRQGRHDTQLEDSGCFHGFSLPQPRWSLQCVLLIQTSISASGLRGQQR